VTITPLSETVRAVVLDIEGTTTPLDFVHEVLFPYARSHALQFLSQEISSPDVRADLAALREEHLADVLHGLIPPSLSQDTQESALRSIVAYVEWLMDTDRKSTPLKSLQGKIWESGYRNGQLRGQVFEDVPKALKRWKERNKDTGIFSSGSVLAQRLLFANTVEGDLTEFISYYFDTSTGSKTDERSYQEIAHILQRSPSQIIFISDVTNELDAARSAGLGTLLSERPGNRPQPRSAHLVVRSLDAVFP
jgi:enolase-phosphatase E1